MDENTSKSVDELIAFLIEDCGFSILEEHVSAVSGNRYTTLGVERFRVRVAKEHGEWRIEVKLDQAMEKWFGIDAFKELVLGEDMDGHALSFKEGLRFFFQYWRSAKEMLESESPRTLSGRLEKISKRRAGASKWGLGGV
jgi:hypothetical protein